MSVENLFKNCQVEYTRDEKLGIYLVKAKLNNRPRVITLTVGKNFSEIALTDMHGKILEFTRQEEGKGISFTNRN